MSERAVRLRVRSRLYGNTRCVLVCLHAFSSTASHACLLSFVSHACSSFCLPVLVGLAGVQVVSLTQPNVLIIGDSVSAGYIPYVSSAFKGVANVQHGPDNAGGGNADGVNYGALCTPYFVRTPLHDLPPWDVITFNYGLHDGTDTNASYTTGLTSIADQLVQTAKDAAPPGRKAARLVYFQTTIPGGANSVPGEPVSPSDKRVQQLNVIAGTIMAARNITVVDLYATMVKCASSCSVRFIIDI